MKKAVAVRERWWGYNLPARRGFAKKGFQRPPPLPPTDVNARQFIVQALPSPYVSASLPRHSTGDPRPCSHSDDGGTCSNFYPNLPGLSSFLIYLPGLRFSVTQSFSAHILLSLAHQQTSRRSQSSTTLLLILSIPSSPGLSSAHREHSTIV